jgi:hypothetical protein
MFCLFGIISLTPIVFVLGPFTGGYFWSEEMKVNIFFGEIEAAPLEKVEDENDEGVSKKNSSSQEELQEIKEELKRTQEELKRTQEEHRKTTQEELITIQEKLITTQEELKKSQAEIITLLKNNK